MFDTTHQPRIEFPMGILQYVGAYQAQREIEVHANSCVRPYVALEIGDLVLGAQ